MISQKKLCRLEGIGEKYSKSCNAGKDLQPRLLYRAKLSFRIKGHIKSFPDKKQLKKFIITKALLYEILKGLTKKKIKTMNKETAINTYLSTIESKKQAKQTRRTETKSWILESILMVARWEEHVGKWVKR